MGYNTENDKQISENSILDFHLSHKTNINFDFQPNEKTSKNTESVIGIVQLLNTTIVSCYCIESSKVKIV